MGSRIKVYLYIQFLKKSFCCADSYHHHIATNTWLGNDIAKADSRQPGLDHFSLNLESKENLEELLSQLRRMEILRR